MKNPHHTTLNTRRLLLLTLCSVMLSACDYKRAPDVAEPGSADALKLALRDSIDMVIIPEINHFKTETGALETTANTFCTTTNETNLTHLQDQWKTLSLQWNRIAMYNIGPLNDDIIFPTIIYIESMRQRGDDYTSTVRTNISTVIGNATVLDQAYFDGLSFTRGGMLALEILVFETSDTHNTTAANIVTDYQSHPRKCEYLQGMSQLMARHANTIRNGWEAEYLDTGKSFRNILLDGELENGTESVPALITALQEHLDYIKRRKLDATLDAQIADYFYPNITAALNSITTLLQGQSNQTYSLYNHMLDGGFAAYIGSVNDNITTAESAATNENRNALSNAIGVLDGNFKREIPDGLNVELGINFTDGD